MLKFNKFIFDDSTNLNMPIPFSLKIEISQLFIQFMSPSRTPLILVFLAKERKKRAMKKKLKRKEEKKMKETNTTKEDFMILMYVTMRVVRLCNT